MAKRVGHRNVATAAEGMAQTQSPPQGSGGLSSYQLKQSKYAHDLEQKIKDNNYEPMDIKAECKGCKVFEDHIGSADGIDAFLAKHAGHYTWTTNNHQPTYATGGLKPTDTEHDYYR